MKTLALLCAAVLLSACASSDGLIDNRVHDCASGQDLMIQVGTNRPQSLGGESSPLGDKFEMLVEISNNSHRDIEVKYVRVEQYVSGGRRPAYQLDNGYKKVDEVIEDGKDITVELPMTGRWMQQPLGDRLEIPGRLELVVTVGQADGDAYRCVFVAER